LAAYSEDVVGLFNKDMFYIYLTTKQDLLERRHGNYSSFKQPFSRCRSK